MLMKLPVCFWCRQLRFDASAILGSARDREYQPVIVNYQPCPGCNKYISTRGVFCYEVRPKNEFSDGRPGLGEPYDDLAPTGRWAMLRLDRVDDLALRPDTIELIRKERKAQFDRASYEAIFAKYLEELKQPFEKVEVIAAS